MSLIQFKLDLSCLADTWTTLHEQYGDVFLICLVFHAGLHGYNRENLVKFQLSGSQTGTRASVHIVVSNKWVKHSFLVTYPFNVNLYIYYTAQYCCNCAHRTIFNNHSETFNSQNLNF